MTVQDFDGGKVQATAGLFLIVNQFSQSHIWSVVSVTLNPPIQLLVEMPVSFCFCVHIQDLFIFLQILSACKSLTLGCFELVHNPQNAFWWLTACSVW